MEKNDCFMDWVFKKKKKIFLLVFFILKVWLVCLFNVGIVGARVKMGDCALDLCCGSGDLAFLLSEKVGSNGQVCSSIVPTLALL